MIRSQRQIIGQEFTTFGITVGTTPVQVNGAIALSSLISTIVFSVPTGAANSVFLGSNAGVTITTGIEIPVGNPQQYRVVNERELIEVESALLDLSTALQCRQTNAAILPFICWDLTQMYLVAVANTAMTIGAFKEMWI